MSTVIPYDPSLVLGNIIEPAALQGVLAISEKQAPIDAAQDKLNSLITMKRSFDMTIQEIISMGGDPGDLITANQEVVKRIQGAANEYAKIRVNQENEIQKIRETKPLVHANIESPIDYNLTQIKKMPLSADSLKLDCQYFSYDENKQEAQNTIAAIRGYISESTSVLSSEFSSAASSSATTQINKQRENHNVIGTLVITATCTHKDAAVLAPFILDVDKAIRAWNTIFPQDKLKINDPISIQQAAAVEGTDQEKNSLNILSGATYGSCFVGMVHILKTESTQTSQSMVSLTEGLQEKFSTAWLIARESGTFALDASFTNDVKNLLSNQTITSHVNLITMGSIPSIKSNEVQIGVKTFADFDPAKMMTNLASFQNENVGARNSIASAASEAQTGAQMLAIQGATVSNVMLGLQKLDEVANKMLDINSLMTAFEDYVDKALAGNLGVPINYYIKPLSKAQLAQAWVGKYFPDKFLTISAPDDKGK